MQHEAFKRVRQWAKTIPAGLVRDYHLKFRAGVSEPELEVRLDTAFGPRWLFIRPHKGREGELVVQSGPYRFPAGPAGFWQALWADAECSSGKRGAALSA